MTEFIANITSYPVSVLTLLLTVILIYWLFTIIGVLGVDLLDGDVEVDVDMDVDVEMDLETPSEGPGGLAGIMLKWGLTGVPITVIVSILVLVSWIICYYLAIVASWITALLPFVWVSWLLGTVALILSVMIAVPIAATLIKPLKGLFVTHEAVNKSDLVGRVVVVKTSEVTSNFGQGILEDGEAGMLLDIRTEASETLSKDDEALLVEFLPNDNCYLVVKKTKAFD